MPSYNIPATEALTNALQEATRSERGGQEFGAAGATKPASGSENLHYRPVEKAVERFINENRAYEKKARKVVVGSY